jgi:hypothetical protein
MTTSPAPQATNNLPEPMTPKECDLRGMPYMPFDLLRLFDSDLYALSTGDEFKAAFTLWGKSFYQIPAGSLPSDDRLLEHLSGSKRWKAVRDMALRGWVKCSDGRLYHKTVAEKVKESWASRIARRERTEAARAARHTAKSPSNSATSLSVTENVTDPVTGSKGTEQNRTEDKKESKQLSAEPVSDPLAPTQAPERPQIHPAPIMPCRNDPPHKWIALAGASEPDGKTGVARPVRNGHYLDTAADMVCEAAKIRSVTWRGDWRPLMAWLDDGISLQNHILPAIRRIADRPNYVPPGSLKYFDNAVREEFARQAA